MRDSSSILCGVWQGWISAAQWIWASGRVGVYDDSLRLGFQIVQALLGSRMVWLRFEDGGGVVHVLEDLDIPTIQWVDHFLRLGVQLYRVPRATVGLWRQGLKPHTPRVGHVPAIHGSATVIALWLQVTLIIIMVCDGIAQLMRILVFVDDVVAAVPTNSRGCDCRCSDAWAIP